ncbi:hypothetical protein BGX26_007147 [Mortierella sp. AD094]|nr:hypothetical protein BGX26_007147 [Mortierella sp. AD094]
MEPDTSDLGEDSLEKVTATLITPYWPPSFADPTSSGAPSSRKRTELIGQESSLVVKRLENKRQRLQLKGFDEHAISIAVDNPVEQTKLKQYGKIWDRYVNGPYYETWTLTPPAQHNLRTGWPQDWFSTDGNHPQQTHTGKLSNKYHSPARRGGKLGPNSDLPFEPGRPLDSTHQNIDTTSLLDAHSGWDATA